MESSVGGGVPGSQPLTTAALPRPSPGAIRLSAGLLPAELGVGETGPTLLAPTSPPGGQAPPGAGAKPLQTSESSVWSLTRRLANTNVPGYPVTKTSAPQNSHCQVRPLTVFVHFRWSSQGNDESQDLILLSGRTPISSSPQLSLSLPRCSVDTAADLLCAGRVRYESRTFGNSLGGHFE